MFGLGTSEIIIILLIALLLFGAKKLPELGKGLGEGIRSFKKASRDIREDIDSSLKDESDTKETSKKVDENAKNQS